MGKKHHAPVGCLDLRSQYVWYLATDGSNKLTSAKVALLGRRFGRLVWSDFSVKRQKSERGVSRRLGRWPDTPISIELHYIELSTKVELQYVREADALAESLNL